MSAFTTAFGPRFFLNVPLGRNEQRDHLPMAAAVLAVAVIILFGMARARRYFIQGVVMSGLNS